MDQRKTRIPIPSEISAEVLYASDNTCCVCRDRGRRDVQIHHIDENPANNELSNLAVLCLVCHNETQIQGGFGRKLNAPLVKKYRNEWVKSVAASRRQGTHQATSRSAKGKSPSMTKQQARRHAERLRSLYKSFFLGVRRERDWAVQVGTRAPDETLSERAQRLEPMFRVAKALIDEALPEIGVEPGAAAVSKAFDSFSSALSVYMTSVAREDSRHTFLGGMELHSSRQRLDVRLQEVQAAIQAHIRAVDKLT